MLQNILKVWESFKSWGIFYVVTSLVAFCTYRQISNIRRTTSQNLKWLSPRLAVVFAQSIKARCSVENEDVVEAAPTGDAPTTSEWYTILLLIKLRLILEIWR